MNTLDEFGKLFINEIRDNAILTLDSIISGKMKSERSIISHRKLEKLSNDQIQLFRELVLMLIDNSLHNTLFMFEESEDYYISNLEGDNLTQLSDGLAGELYSEDGWIAKYSRYSRSI